MSFTLNKEAIASTRHPGLDKYREAAKSGYRDDLEIDLSRLEEDALQDLRDTLERIGDKKSMRALESVMASRKGIFSEPIPNFKAFSGVLESYLSHEARDGWVYVEGLDGLMHPELVTSVSYDDDSRARGPKSPKVILHTIAYTMSDKKIASHCNSHRFTPAEVTRQRVADVLAAQGIFKETAELRAEYDARLERHRRVIQNAFAKQFRATGFMMSEGYGESMNAENRKVVFDMTNKDYGPRALFSASSILPEGEGPVPEHTMVRVFDLKMHQFYWVASDFLTPYEYDQSLGDKLILPRTHRDLLNVLTSDISVFADDIIEGKSAGNIVLCKGLPGVGKTLTAEVYGELIQRPIYAVHAGTLGTTAEDIERNLEEIFARVERWDCILLLDEADVFVARRGDDIERNAIVAEFLRTLEYFGGLMFMTTNRPDDIDDAIVSRCAAVIDYEPPNEGDARKVWQVLFDHQQVEVPEGLIDGLVALFPTIVPRDMKMLLRLVLRMARSQAKAIDLDLFRQCAMFRAVKMKA